MGIAMENIKKKLIRFREWIYNCRFTDLSILPDFLVLQVKVIDLGMSVVVKSVEEKVTGVVGTWGYHAPEMWEEKPYDAKADIFSLAITFLVLVIHYSFYPTGKAHAATIRNSK